MARTGPLSPCSLQKCLSSGQQEALLADGADDLILAAQVLSWIHFEENVGLLLCSRGHMETLSFYTLLRELPKLLK